ncbi:MAG: response regulator [Candidatus Peribacteraceae bacterium]|jgi:ActR/RegA family two-component response regulator
MKLLIAKDDEGVRSVESIAQDAGIQPADITVARTAEAALDALAVAVPDMAIVDPHLTERMDLEDGIALIGAITQRNHECIVICLTGSGSITLGCRAIQRGARDYIDCDLPHVNWCSYLRQKVELWRGVLRAERDEGNTVQ